MAHNYITKLCAHSAWSHLPLSAVLLHLLVAHLHHALQQLLGDGPTLQLHKERSLWVLFSKLCTHRQLLVWCMTAASNVTQGKVKSFQTAEGFWTLLSDPPKQLPGLICPTLPVVSEAHFIPSCHCCQPQCVLGDQ